MVSMPDYPDPMETANAQAGMNRDSVISSALINNYDQDTPWGSVRYNQQGTRSFTDSQGQNIEVPYFRQDVSLSPDQSVTWGNMSKAYNNLSGMAANSSGLLSQYLSTPFDPNYGVEYDYSTVTEPVTEWKRYSGGELDQKFDQWYTDTYGQQKSATTDNGFEGWYKQLSSPMDMGWSVQNKPSNFADVEAYAGGVSRASLPLRYQYQAGERNADNPNPNPYLFQDDGVKDYWRQVYDRYAADQIALGRMPGQESAGPSVSRDAAFAEYQNLVNNSREGDSRYGYYSTTGGSGPTVRRRELSENEKLNDWQNYSANSDYQRYQADNNYQRASVGDFSEDRRRVEEAIMSRYNTDFARDEADMDAKLRAQGLMPGTEAYGTQYDALTRQKTDARMQAILAGGQEQTRLNDLAMRELGFNNDLIDRTNQNRLTETSFNNSLIDQTNQNNYNQAAFNNQLRQSKLAEMLTLRNQPINEVIGLLQGSQINMPQFSAPFQAGVQAPNYMDLVDKKYQADAQAAQASGQGLFSILGMIPGMFSMSDRRTKHGVERVGEVGKLGVYRFAYLGTDATVYGLMSDEVDPRAVHKVGGVDTVNYLEALRHAG